MKKWTCILSVLALAGSAAQGKSAALTAPLFASDVPVSVTIQGPLQTLVRNRNSPPVPATLVADGVTYPIALSSRGIFRKATCEFPPIKIEFKQPPPSGSLFEGQHDLKLVAFCKRAVDFQQKVLLEYSAYRLYNLITPVSFRARLVNVDYVDEGGRPYISRVGIFIEPVGGLAKRNGLKVARMGSFVPLQQVDPTWGARMAVFEYMISNYDWSMHAGPQGSECCHNSKMLTNGAAGALLTVVPYDFDFSGLVSAPYAEPPEGIPVDSVRQRIYRGYCAHLPQARTIAAQLSPRRGEFTGIFATIPGLAPAEQAKAAKFINAAFDDLDSGKIFKSCV
jgi:hypothetical protein